MMEEEVTEFRAGSHCGYSQILEKKLGVKLPHIKKFSHLKTGVDTTVHHYGIRGGHGYWSDSGQWYYGERPAGVPIPKFPEVQELDPNLAVPWTPESHVKDVLHTELGITDSGQFLAGSPTDQVIHFRNAVVHHMEKRGFSKQEAEEAYRAVKRELETAGSLLQPVQWKTGTAKESILEKELDDRLQLVLRGKGIKMGHEGEALVALPKEQWDQFAQEVAQEIYTNPFKHIGASPGETVAEQIAQNKKRVLERIMEIRYQTQYLETPPEHSKEKQLDFDDDPDASWGVMAPRKVVLADHALKKLKDVIWNTDRFNEIPKENLPLKLAMDDETGPLLAQVGPRAAVMLGILYGHAFNTDAARYLAGFAHASRTQNMSTDMALINHLVTQATEKQELVRVEDLKNDLKKLYGPKFWTDRGAQSSWEAIAYQLSKAGMTDVADVIGEAFVPPMSSLKAVPLGEHPMTHEIEPDDYEPGDELYKEWTEDIAQLDYHKDTRQDDIDEYINDHLSDIESQVQREMAREWMDDHPEEYDRILKEHIDGYMEANSEELVKLQEEYLEDSVARSRFYDVALYNVEYQAKSDFQDLAEEEVQDDVSDKAQEIAQEQAEDYASSYGGSSAYDDREKAKIDIMNTLGAMLEKDHGITPEECRAFFNVISDDVKDEYVANAQGIDRMTAGATAHLVGCWAGSSDGDHPVSNAMQILIPEVFPEVPAWEEKPEHAGNSAWSRAQRYAQDPEFARVASAFLKAMYEHTQNEFKSAGVTHIVVARGVSGGLTPEIEQSLAEGRKALQGTAGYIKGTSNFITNPMTSWSWSASTSEGFSTPEHVVFVAKVPIERIIGTFRTGYGCLEEEEAVVLGGGGTVQWYGLARGNTHVGRPGIVTRAQEAKPNAPRTLAMEEHAHFKSTYVPGSAYDADTRQVVKGTISKVERIHNDEAEDYNRAILTEKGQRIAAGLRAVGIITEKEEDRIAQQAASLTGQVSGKHSPTAIAIYKLATEMPTMPSGIGQNSYRRQVQIDNLVAQGVPGARAEEVHDAMYGKFVKKSFVSSRLQKATNRAIALSRKIAYTQRKEG